MVVGALKVIPMALAFGNHLMVNPFLFHHAHSLKLCEDSLPLLAVRADEIHNLRY
jgi:hypothetical protein